MGIPVSRAEPGSGVPTHWCGAMWYNGECWTGTEEKGWVLAGSS